MANQLQVVLFQKPRTQNDIVIVKKFYILLFLFTLTVQLRFLNFQSLIKRKWNIRYMYHHNWLFNYNPLRNIETELLKITPCRRKNLFSKMG